MRRELRMATSKGKKGKAKKSTPSRKSRLWLRDLLNILGGLLAGAFGFWIVQEVLISKTRGEVSQRYRTVIQEDLPALKKASDRYEALLEGEGDVSEAMEGLDVSGALFGLDAYQTVPEDLADLDAKARPVLLTLYLNLRDAELLRKLLIEQREHPEQMPQILSREFLRALHEGTRLIPRILWALGPNDEP
jgi:hypothetical protein